MRKTTNSGSALHILLLAIVLFAAVSAVVTQSGKGGSDILRPEKAKLYAGEIINFANQVTQGVGKAVMLNDCPYNQLSFERAPFDGSDAGYVNTNSPSDFSCHIFHPQGGGVVYRDVDADWQVSSPTYKEWLMSGLACFYGLGSGEIASNCTGQGTEIYISVYELKREVCDKLNEQLSLNIDPVAAKDSISSGKFQGGVAGTYFIGDSVDALKGKKSFCIQDSDGSTQDEFVFLHALMIR